MDAVVGAFLAVVAFAVMELAFQGGLLRAQRLLVVIGSDLREKGTQYRQEIRAGIASVICH